MMNSRLPAPRRREQWPSGFLPTSNGVLVNSSSFCPFYKRMGFIAVRYEHIASSVAALFNARGPSAIPARVLRAWPGVWAVVINAVKSHSVRAWAHVAIERIERNTPFLRHGNATPAVVSELPAAAVKASLLSPVPRFIFLRLAHAVNRVGCRKSCAPVYTLAATSGRFLAKFLPNNDGQFSARAPTIPLGASVRCALWLKPNYHKVAEYLAGKVFEIYPSLARFFCSHAAHPPLVSGLVRAVSVCQHRAARSILPQCA